MCQMTKGGQSRPSLLSSAAQNQQQEASILRQHSMLPQQPFAAAKAPAEAASRPAAMEILTSFDFMVEVLLSLKS
jgi:hypothetical protein